SNTPALTTSRFSVSMPNSGTGRLRRRARMEQISSHANEVGPQCPRPGSGRRSLRTNRPVSSSSLVAMKRNGLLSPRGTRPLYSQQTKRGTTRDILNPFDCLQILHLVFRVITLCLLGVRKKTHADSKLPFIRQTGWLTYMVIPAAIASQV